MSTLDATADRGFRPRQVVQLPQPRFRSCSQLPPFRHFLSFATSKPSIRRIHTTIVVWAPKRGQPLSLYFHSVSLSLHSSRFPKNFSAKIFWPQFFFGPSRRQRRFTSRKEGRASELNYHSSQPHKGWRASEKRQLRQHRAKTNYLLIAACLFSIFFLLYILCF